MSICQILVDIGMWRNVYIWFHNSKNHFDKINLLFESPTEIVRGEFQFVPEFEYGSFLEYMGCVKFISESGFDKPSKYLKECKYINSKQFGMIVFPGDGITHAELASSLDICTQAGIISAGFVVFNWETKQFETYGESISLRKKSLASDASLFIQPK